MRKLIAIFAAVLFAHTCYAAAPRVNQEPGTRNQQPVTSRAAINSRAQSPATSNHQPATSRAAITPRVAAPVSARSAVAAPRAAVRSAARSATPFRSATNARAAIVAPSVGVVGMVGGYNSCRDVYFTCMDQFCAAKDDKYGRCVCSARLPKIQADLRTLDQAAGSLRDFADYNINAIPKTAAEVNAMLSATGGENAITSDESDAAAKLAGISSILGSAKKNALSTAGTLDIAGSVTGIWQASDLIGSGNVNNLTGVALYDQMHLQCAAMAQSACQSGNTLDMVVSAYGMYIEQDCNMVAAGVYKQRTAELGAISAAEREMNIARLENYNAHNSDTINTCIAKVRQDITASSACG
ncbi:MAG: hypothetical protein LBR41_00235, partial [Rickettsiales bacterium]|nr:hypothetical protein [Rickettsiales bacterium]